MKSVLCLTLLVAFVALINGAAVVPKPEEHAKDVVTEELIAKIRQEVADNILKHRVDNVIKKMRFRQAIMGQAKDNGLKFLCKPCKTIFTDVRDELESVEQITAPLLKTSIDNACKKYVGSIPFVEKTCDKLGETAVDDLLKWLLDEEEKINPERSCIFLHLC